MVEDPRLIAGIILAYILGANFSICFNYCFVNILCQLFLDELGIETIKGTGLGLYISKQIVLAHHGEIWAESDGVGKGSTFYMRLRKA